VGAQDRTTPRFAIVLRSGRQPKSPEAIQYQCDEAGLTFEERVKIFGGTIAELYGIAEPPDSWLDAHQPPALRMSAAGSAASA
jgi:hypothetical protein